MNAIITATRLRAVFCTAIAFGALTACGDIDDTLPGEQVAAESAEELGLGELHQAASASDSRKLCVRADHREHSGTSDDVVMKYSDKQGNTWECTITETISAGEKVCCTDEEGESDGQNWTYEDNKFRVQVQGNNGLAIDRLYTEVNGNEYTTGRFDDAAEGGSASSDADCRGCSGAFDSQDCDRCWADGDGACANLVFFWRPNGRDTDAYCD